MEWLLSGMVKINVESVLLSIYKKSSGLNNIRRDRFCQMHLNGHFYLPCLWSATAVDQHIEGKTDYIA